jgi:hypothetical protein
MNANKAVTATFTKQTSGSTIRLNKLPWQTWYEWHNTWVKASSTFLSGSYSTLTSSDIGTTHSGLSLAITKQDLSLPLKGKDLWLRFTVAVKSVTNEANWIRAAIVPRIDPVSGISSTLDRYTELDFYQGSNTHPRSGGDFQCHVVGTQQPDSEFMTYTVHLTPILVSDWGQSVYDSYMLTYLAPTIEMKNSGMTILIQDVQLWQGAPP